MDADRWILIRAVVWGACGFTALAGGASVALGVGSIGTQALILLGAALVGAGLGVGVASLAGYSARGIIHALFAAGNLPPAPSFSYQESLAARGRHAEAAESYRQHLAAHPADHDARLALSALLAGPLGDHAAAERLLLDVRAGAPSPRHEAATSHALIDLYEATGQRGKHLAELARFADRYRGTEAGRAAKRALGEMKGTEGDGRRR